MPDRRSTMEEYLVAGARRVTLDVAVGDGASGAVTVSLDRVRVYSGRGRRGIALGPGDELEGSVMQAVAVVSRVISSASRVSVMLTLKGGSKREKITLAQTVDHGDDVELVARVRFI